MAEFRNSDENALYSTQEYGLRLFEMQNSFLYIHT